MALGDIAARMPWPVFACDAEKHPLTKNGFYGATRDATAIMRQFRNPAAAMIGIPTGKASGIIAIDIDIKDGRKGQEWLDENVEALPPTRTHKSRTGGLHLLFRLPDGVEIRNSQSRVAPGVDVRGEGGYLIVPPSPGYSVADPADFSDMPIWLIKACLKPDTPAPAPLTQQDRVERYTQSAIDGEVLAVVRAVEGTRNDTLNKAAVKLGSLVGAGQMSRSTAEVELTRAAQMAGLEAREIAATIKSGLDFGVQHPRELPKSNGRINAPAEPPPDIDDPGIWQDARYDEPGPDDEIVVEKSPVPVSTAHIYDPWNALRPVRFPIETIPEPLRSYVLERAHIMGADPAATAWACLSACSAAIDGRIRLKMKRHDSWTVPAALWLAFVGAPSTKKTPIVGLAWSPLERIQARALAAHRRAVAEWKTLPKDEKARIPEPTQPRRLVSHDATMESVQEILQNQDRGLGILRDELAGWVGSLEKYAPGKGGAADRAFALQSYNGVPHVVDRVMRGTLSINNLLCVICGGIQPDRLRQFSDLADDGLWQRFIPIIVAPATIGSDEPGPDGDAYSELIEQLLRVHPDTRLELCDDAHAIRLDVQQRVFALEQSEVLGARFVGFMGKLAGVWGRLTMVLHLICEPRSHVVRAEMADAARVLLFKSILPNAARVYTAMGGAGADAEATQSIAGYILTKKLDRLVMSDLTSNVRVCRGRSAEDVRKLLSPLEAGGWLMPEADYQPKSWLVSAFVHDKFADRAEKEITRRAAVRALITGVDDESE